MAITTQQIVDFLAANPNMSDADIASAMAKNGVNPAQLAAATGISVNEVISRIASTVPQGSSITLGDTRIAPNYEIRGSGEDQQIGPLQNIFVEKTTGDINYKAPTGSTYQQLSADGTFERTGVTQKTASFLGGLGEMLNDPFVQAILLGGGVGGAIGGSLGLTGSTAQAVGTGLFKGGSALAGGAELEDALKVGLITGGLSYGGGELNKAIKYQDVPVDFNTMSTDQINQAVEDNFRNDLAKAGLSSSQINSYLANPASIYDASFAETPEITSAPTSLLTETPEVTTPQVDTRGLLSNVSQIPITETVEIASAPIQQIDKSVFDLVNSQIAANVATPISTVPEQVVTTEKPVTTQDVVNAITAPISTVATPIVEQILTSNKPATTQEIANAVIATVPNITTQQAQTIAEQVITSGQPVTNQDVVNAITATIPAITPTTPVATQTITGQKPITTQEIVNAITASIPAVTTPTTTPLATQTITAPKEVTVEEIVDSITATIPTITPIEPQVIAEQVVTSEKPITTQQVIDAITSIVPVTPAPITTPEQIITAEKPITTQDVIEAIPTVTPKVTPIITPEVITPEQVITAEKPITIQDVIDVVTNLVPTTPVVTPTVVTPEQVITAEKPITVQDIIDTVVAIAPTVVPTTPVVTSPEVVITNEKPITAKDVIDSIIASIPTFTPEVVPEVKVTATNTPKLTDVISTIIASTPTITTTPEPIVDTKPTVEQKPDPLKVAQTVMQATSLLGAGSAVNEAVNQGNNQYPIVPIPTNWTSPTATGVAPFTPFPPIDFGTRELLKGTQWEKFLSPTYGQTQQFVRYPQPTGMSYSDLMGILGNKQNPTRSNLSINDIISGIQNQYGQTPTSTMG